MDLSIAKDGTTGFFAVRSTSESGLIFSGKLIIYLDDGAVITCIDSGKSDHVDETAISAYYLTNEDLSKIKNSNINTVRYTL